MKSSTLDIRCGACIRVVRANATMMARVKEASKCSETRDNENRGRNFKCV